MIDIKWKFRSDAELFNSHEWERAVGDDFSVYCFRCKRCKKEEIVIIRDINSGRKLYWENAISCEEERMRRAIG